MLDKVIMLPFTMVLIFMFFFVGITGVIMFGQWCMIQNQAQFVATSMGKWGGLTTETKTDTIQFANEINHTYGNDLRLNVSNSGYPAPWGQEVWAEIKSQFNFEIGEIEVGVYELTGYGRSVSTYLDGAYSASYTYP